MNLDFLDFKTIMFFIGVGVIPALVWLWFWLKEDEDHPEPKGLLFFTFLLGALAVVFVLPLEKWAKNSITNNLGLITTWAAIEEVMKFMAVALIALQTSYLDEAIDFPIYFITAALGFASLENILFLKQAGGLTSATASLLTGSLRFLGATLLHSISSGLIGVMMGLAYNHNKFTRRVYLLGGLVGAVALHTVFNFFIIKDSGQDFLKIFGLFWVFTVIFILIMEKLRRISHENNYQLATNQ